MPTGAGKYDIHCSRILSEEDADAVVVMVINGHKGNGFSVNSADPVLALHLPAILREMADSIEQDLKRSPEEK